MAERIYVMNEEGTPQPLEKEPFAKEEILQALLAEHPELLDGEQIKPGDPRRWILIDREVGISEAEDASPIWSLDLLLIDQDAVPTLVEVKRGENREVRRAIVGQLLEYAAGASKTWTVAELRDAFEKKHGENADAVLYDLLRSDDAAAEKFWESVRENLKEKDLRLLFVSDQIPDTLRRIVEFLNEKMPTIEVLAVEIKQFRGESLQTFVPEVIGRITAPDRSARARRKMSSRLEFYERFDSPEGRRAAKRLIAVADEEGAEITLHEQAVVIGMEHSHNSFVNVAWLYPTAERAFWCNSTGFTFRCGQKADIPLSEEARTWFEAWKKQFKQDSFTTEINSNHPSWLPAWVIDPVDADKHIDILEKRLRDALVMLKTA